MKLDLALKELIDEGCMQKALYDALVVKNVKIDFGMMTNTAPGGYNPSTKKISFSNNEDITSETLKEELFHAWQDAFYPGGISQYLNVGKVNIEFEVKVFKDIIMDFGGFSAFFNYGTPEEQRIRDEYGVWIYSMQDDISILQDQSAYNYWLDLFGKHNPDYSSPKSNQLSGFNSLDNLINMSNCF